MQRVQNKLAEETDLCINFYTKNSEEIVINDFPYYSFIIIYGNIIMFIIFNSIFIFI